MKAAELTRLFASGAEDPVALTERVLARLAPRPVFAPHLPERALAAAARSRERWRAGRPLGPLDGVPVAVKDLLDVSGTITAAGSAVLKRLRRPAASDAPAVGNLEAAGAVIVAKTQLNELAFSGLGLNPHFGTPANALRSEWVPGGSSSGSAVAVARGLVPLAVGSDTGGSARIPAAFNGLVGFKPSNGRVSTKGVTPLSPTLDTIGSIAGDVADARALFQGLAGQRATALEPWSGPARLLVPAALLERSDPQVRRAFEEAAAALAEAGYEPVTADVPELAEVYRLYGELGPLAAHEALALYRELIAEHGGEMDRRVVRRVLEVASRDRTDYLRLLAARARLLVRFWRRYRNYEALLLPTVPAPPPLLAEVEASDEAFFRANNRALAHTMLFNFYGGPAISLPLTGGIGLMLAAAPGRDEELFSLAASVEMMLKPPVK
jgi:aspartyl-tRNA(Asn)/glutamyl-tRNA(Gln) amidotransferase subunit A